MKNAAQTFRRATVADLPQAVALRAAMDQELSGRDPDARGAQWRENFVDFYATRMASGTAAIFMAEDGDHTIAMAIVYKLVNHRSEIFGQPSAYITSVYVVPERRREGIASKLTGLALAWARQNGCIVARLRTSPFGRPVYAKLGFTPTDEMELQLT